MKKNVGISDRIIRFVIVDLLLSLSLVGLEIPETYATIIFIVSIILVLTVLIGYSPIYHLLGISTKDEALKNQTSVK